MADSSKNTPSAGSKKSVATNVKETLESVVVAFILAFVFRAFIVEAFVIPTGSMAVTLYGKQLTKTCSTCGYEYTLGVPTQYDLNSYKRGIKLCCPNCNMQTDEFRFSEFRRPDSGDRILVQKWPFVIGGPWLGPQRWDVTVFKNPKDGTINFIKRMIGLPGEVLEIIDGDIYTANIEDIEKVDPQIITQLDALSKQIHQFKQSEYDSNYLNSDLNKLEKRYRDLNYRLIQSKLLKIQRKTEKAQQSLWFNVYNHDFLPNYDRFHDHPPIERVGWWPDPNTPAAQQAWDTSKREITFASGDHQASYIRFAGKPIDDFYAYNNDGIMEVMNRRIPPRRPVGDLRLRFTWFADAGNGEIILEMNRDQDLFIATINSDGTARVVRKILDSDFPEREHPLGQKQLPPLLAGRAYEVEFVNVDYCVSLLINDEKIVESTYAPKLEKLLKLTAPVEHDEASIDLVKSSVIRIGARNLQCRLRHVVLERDIYYRSQKRSNVSNLVHNLPCWGTAGYPILLREKPGEYFMLGDNSPASMDSRLWWDIGPHLAHMGDKYQIGTVPEDQLIGKAFFVYWPAGYRPSWGGGIGLIPNVGRMRWIR